MSNAHSYLAVDLGAESGRVVRGVLDGDRLRLEEAARFATGMVPIRGHVYWNLIRLYEEMIRAFKTCAGAEIPVESIGVDSWGVDFALLSRDGSPAGLPVAYRDIRTQGMMEKLFEIVPKKEIYARTGIQFLPFNTLYQLFAMAQNRSGQLATAEKFLMVPDFFHYLFTGKTSCEFTNATTSQIFNVHENTWDTALIEKIGVRADIFPDAVKPGTVIGNLTQEMRDMTGLCEIPVIAPATHDTGSAIAAAPAKGKNWAYISSGTWSLMGIEIDQPITTDQAMRFNFTNEGGVNGTYRFLKNIIGLWLVQRCRAGFDKEYSYSELTQMAGEATAFKCLIDPDDERFVNPPNMPQAIEQFCRETGQPTPASPGEFVRCALESLALQYRSVLEQLRHVQDMEIDRVHIIGGGTQNRLLCQFTADALALPVIAGPVEATAIGNLIVQAQALGHIDSHEKARELVQQSFELVEYQPRQCDKWNDAWRTFKTTVARNR